jgi:putative addiction module killer protein/probable addiction module antidote protein
LYFSASGECPFEEWFDRLKDGRTRGRILARINRLRLGNAGDWKALGGGVFEMRLDYGPGYRIYFGQEGSRITILLVGGTKGTQTKDIKERKDTGMSTKRANRPKTSDYKDFLFKRLQDEKLAADYLTAALTEGEDAFLLALKDVAEARGGLGSLAKRANLNREGLYEMLSEKGNPRFSSLSAIMDALGIKLQFVPKAA